MIGRHKAQHQRYAAANQVQSFLDTVKMVMLAYLISQVAIIRVTFVSGSPVTEMDI